MVEHLSREAMKRDQDSFGEWHYTDFTGYGFQEAVENHLCLSAQWIRKSNFREPI